MKPCLMRRKCDRATRHSSLFMVQRAQALAAQGTSNPSRSNRRSRRAVARGRPIVPIGVADSTTSGCLERSATQCRSTRPRNDPDAHRCTRSPSLAVELSPTSPRSDRVGCRPQLPSRAADRSPLRAALALELEHQSNRTLRSQPGTDGISVVVTELQSLEGWRLRNLRSGSPESC